MLKGHLKAVTSLDWKILKDGKQYLVSCSDDDFIRVYNPSKVSEDGTTEAEFLYAIDTHFITDWHTLTYLALEDVKD